MSPPTQQARKEIEESPERSLLRRSFGLRACPRPKGWNKILLACSFSFLLTVGVAMDLTLLIPHAFRTGASGVETRAVETPSQEESSFPRESTIQNNGTTLCEFFRQWELSGKGTRVSVCDHRGEIRIDFRLFLGDKATIKGMYLTQKEFCALLKLWGPIQESIWDAYRRRQPRAGSSTV